MGNQKYRFVLIGDEDPYNTYSYLCEDETINVDDYVLVEGQENALKVSQIKYIAGDMLPFPISKFKKVIKKVNVDDKLKEIVDCSSDENKDNSSKSSTDNNSSTYGIESNTQKEKEDLKKFKGIKAIAKVDFEFSYIDYHADCLMKIKDDSYTSVYSLIKEIALINHTENHYEELIVKISFTNDAFKMNDIQPIKMDAFEESLLRIPFLKVDKLYLESLTESETASVKIELYDQKANKTISSEEYAFMILPISQPSSFVINEDVRLYAKFVTPLAPKVKQIALNAVTFNKGNPIITYQNCGKDKYNDMLEEAQSIYLALHDSGIVYQNPPAGNLYNQRVRMPEEVLKDKKGTCLDLSILFCACLEEVGFNSILVLIDGHAFAGFFLDKGINFPNAVEYQCGKVYNYATGGMNKIVLVECTSFAASDETSFNEAMRIGLSNIKMYDGQTFSAIDINLAHRGIFSPIPTHGNDFDLELLIRPKEIKDKELDTIVETKYVDVLRQEEKDRFTFWERKLLDLTEANPIVNFKLKTSNCLKMTCDTKIQDLLIENNVIKFACIPLKINNETTDCIENEFIKGTTKPSDIFGSEFDKSKMLGIGYEKTLKNLIKKSNSAMDETGAPTLYLCLGILTYNRKKEKAKGHAPFMVLPINISKDKLGPYYTITYDYDDIMINQTFFEYYKQEHPGIDFGELYQINADDKYMDIVHTFKANNTADIQLDEDSFFIANLTFSHYIMWQDIRKRKDELKKNKVIQSILENRNVLDDDFKDLDSPIDELEQYHNFAAPLYYDSTQLKAILKCGEGKSFILDGPPGTGKSQTIVNMIVNAFYHGKTVLFVAEKKAALDVVADRLRKLGDPDTDNNLGRFCLELHSNKANKSEFFEKLKSSMELGATKNPEEFEQRCKTLEIERDKILLTINKMHEKKYYYSLYDAIVKQEELSEFDYNIEFDEQYLLSLTDEKMQNTYNLIDTYIASASHINDFNRNPLKILKVDNINYYDRNNVLSDFSNAKISISNFIESYKNLVSNFEFEFDLSQDVVALLMDALDLCFNKKIYFESLIKFMGNNSDELISSVFEASEKLIDLKYKTKNVFNFDLIENVDANLALEELNQTMGFIAKFKTRMKWKKNLKNILLPTHKLNTKNLIGYFQQITEYYHLSSFIKNNNDLLSDLINDDYFTKLDELKSIKEKYYNTRKFLENIKQLSIEKDFVKVATYFMNLYASQNQTIKMSYILCAEKYKSYKEIDTKLCDRYKIDYRYYHDSKNNYVKIITLLDYSSNENHFNELIDIANINRISQELELLGLGTLLDAIIQNKFDYKNFKEIYDLSCVSGYIKLYFKDDDINYFNPSTFEAEVKKYRNLINEYNDLVIQCVSAKLTKNLNHNNIDYANSSPIGRLKKSISNKGRGVSIRETLLNYDDIIKKYFPCFLMSPLSAAQYLAVDEKDGKSVSKFDLVIFDEASQIPTHEAVGPIARGKSLIVAGDPEQMPPSAYFSAGLELAEDEVQFDDAISLLDECIAIELPRIRLSYHYRSKHESLISFSNHNFYNDGLYTFPSTNTAKSLVEFNYIELKADKKNSSISKEELKAICDVFKNIYTNEKTKHKSLGIIVFNMKQQEKVYDAICDLLANNTQLHNTVEEAFNKTKEPWFVKSLENVQGDERDIIILSIGFRKNAAGRAIVIGPIARENGQRRLNVAVSRSKERMIVLSTIKYTDFEEDSKIKNRGQLLLKQFLKYAQEQTFKVSDGSRLEKASIITFIKKDLENRGFTVALNIGNSDFKVDLAIINKSGDAYELGILIDSQSLGKDISCRDKFYVQEAVLNSLKWKIINIYSLEYFKDRNRTIDKIVEAMDRPYIQEEYHIKAHIEKANVQEFNYNSKEYTKVVTKNHVTYNNKSGFDFVIKALLYDIISFESPVSFETIKIRIREHSNIQSMSAKAQVRLEHALLTFRNNATQDQNQIVYWANNMSKEILRFRINSDRDLYNIPKEEILCAMNQILKVQGDIEKEDLFRITLDAFKYGQSVLNKKNQDRLDYVYNWAKSQGKIYHKR